jgi:hypothetical protein
MVCKKQALIIYLPTFPFLSVDKEVVMIHFVVDEDTTKLPTRCSAYPV